MEHSGAESAHYELTSLLGRGGMGSVYRAVHRPSGQAVAVKTLSPGFGRDPRLRRLLLNEAAAAAQLRHPNIVGLMDVGRGSDGAPFLVMELVDGHDLSRWFDAWPGWAAIAAAFDDVLEGLAAAHAAGIVHRDLKPENLLLAGGKGGRVKIADFGIARVVDPLAPEAPSNEIAGTPLYMAPEQVDPDAQPGPTTDLYAVGVMLFELLSGTAPFASENPTAILAAKLGAPAPRLAVRDGLDTPDALRTLVASLIERDPRRRPRFAREVRDALGALSARVLDHVPPTARSSPRGSILPPGVDTRPAGADVSSTVARTAELSTRALATGDTVLAQDVPESLAPNAPTTPPERLPAAPADRPGATLARVRETPLAGRESERSRLTALIDATCARGGSRALLLVGEAGAGKSRLARWGLAEVERRGCMEGLAAGYDLAGAERAGGLRLALRRVIGLPRGRAESTPRAVPPEWQWFLGEHAGDAGDAGEGREACDPARLDQWLRVGANEDLPSAEQAGDIAAEAIRALSRVRPVYLWIDDLGWSRDGALDLVERLSAMRDARVLVVATLRTGTAQYPPIAERLERLRRSESAEVLAVPPLSRAERRALITSIVPVAVDLADALVDRVDGTPLALVQAAHEWIDAGALVPGEGGLVPRPGLVLDDLVAARTMDGMIDQRVAALTLAFGPERDRAERVLFRAASLGVRFEEGALALAARGDGAAGLVDELLERALLHGLVRTDGPGAYRFDHGLVQERLRARAAALPEPVRRTLARDAAEAMLDFYGPDSPDVGAPVAELLHEAGEVARAWSVLQSATRRVARAGDDQRAVAFLAIARRWLAEGGNEVGELFRGEVDQLEARVHYFALRYPQALAALARAVERFRACGEPRRVFQARALESMIYFYQDRFADAERLALELAPQVRTDDRDLARLGATLTHLLANIATLRGDFPSARAHNLASLEYTRASGEAHDVRAARCNVAVLDTVLGMFDEAAGLLDEVAAECTSASDRAYLHEVLLARARLMLYRGHAAEARKLFEAAYEEIAARQDRWQLTELLLVAALLSVELDDAPTAARATETFIAAFRAVPHEEAGSVDGMRRLEEALANRGLGELSAEVRALREARTAAFRAGGLS